jgi:stage II sporulation protein D
VIRPLAAAVVLVATSAAPAAAAGVIGVALVEQARAVEVRGSDVEVLPLGRCERCRARPWRMDAVRAVPGGSFVDVDGVRAPGFRLASDRPLRLNGREYAAPLEVLRSGEGIAVIGELPLEDYLPGVLRAETGDRFPREALRAQAIVARTYAAHQRLISAGKPYHIVASTAHQQYAGRVAAGSPAWEAVRETTGQVLLWEGEVFPAFYHTESGGYTEDPRTVFAARNMPALRPVVCPFSAGSPHYYWNLDLRLADVSEALRRGGVDVGQVRAIVVAQRTPSLRATTVRVEGSRGSAQVRGNDFRRMLGYDSVKSTLFAVAVDGDVARFAGRGYGHGVGMCQWGAKGMAERGYSARQILEFYYPGTTFGALNGGGVWGAPGAPQLQMTAPGAPRP